MKKPNLDNQLSDAKAALKTAVTNIDVCADTLNEHNPGSHKAAWLKRQAAALSKYADTLDLTDVGNLDPREPRIV